MKKLLITLLLISSSVILFAQQDIYSDDKLDVKFTLEKITDEVNDRFEEHYALEITNTSQNTVSFVPVLNYKSELGKSLSSINHDESDVITLAPGEVIKGDPLSDRMLTLFKQYLVGNSGKRASHHSYTLESVNIQYQ